MELSSRSWVLIGICCMIVMFGVLHVLRSDPSPDTLGGSLNGGEVPLNTLDGDLPPRPDPLPLPAMEQPVPSDDRHQMPFPSESQSSTESESPKPVVWVTEENAMAYQQPGFNMPEVRKLERWEELQVVESTRENWDRVTDIEGNEFWVQKKVLTVIRPQNLSQPSIAEKKVMDFYTAVAHSKHSDAYMHLSPEWKRELSYDRFVDGYSRTDSLRSEIVNVFELAQDRYQVDVAMEAVEEGEPVDYLGIYTVERVDDAWFLTSGSLRRQARRF